MLRALTFVFLICACSSSGQLLNNPHLAAAFPGDSLQFRSHRKLTGRSRLVGSIAPPAVSATSLGIPRRETLPTVSFSSATVNLYDGSFVNGNGQTVVVQRADVAFQNIRTPDGYALPTFGFYFIRAVGTTVAFLGIDAGDPNLENIPGFTQGIFFIVDTSARTVSAPNLTLMAAPLQRLIFALAANLASVFQNATHVNVAHSTLSLPVWSISDVIATPRPSPISSSSRAQFSGPSSSARGRRQWCSRPLREARARSLCRPPTRARARWQPTPPGESGRRPIPEF